METFDVGNNIWYVDGGKPVVKYFLVVEEIVKNTVSGQSREYIFQTVQPVGKKGDSKVTVSSKNLNGLYFTQREDVFNHMISQASTAINHMLDNLLGDTNEPITQQIDSSTLAKTNVEEEEHVVELPDGTKARLKGGFPK